MSSQEKLTRVNEEVRTPQIRLINVDGSQLGIVSNTKAQQLAQEAGVDLVEIAPNADPPVCKLMDYRKYLFEQNKIKAAQKKKQKKIDVKEMSFRPNTGESDFRVKLKKIIEFLSEGDKVKISLRFRGREMTHQELGIQLIDNLKAELDEYAVIEQSPKLEGRQIFMLVAPKKPSSKSS